VADQIFKLVITGAFNTGKTTFIRSLSDIAAVDTDKSTTTAEEQRVKASTTVAMDYGRFKLDGIRVQLFGTPGQPRFDFMREILAKDMNGFLVMVDLADPSTIDAAATLVEQFKDYQAVPYAVVANKSDLNSSVSPTTLRDQLQLPAEIHIYLCTATERESVREVVRRFMRDARK